MDGQVMQRTEKTAQSAPAQSAVDEQPWYAAFPKARSEPKSISRQEMLQLLKDDTGSGVSTVLVDLRRTDYEGGTISGSINLPAQTLWPTIPSLYKIFKAGDVSRVIWYCGSSRGRGNRAAAWFADHLDEKGDTSLQSLVLDGGIKAWVAEKGDFIQYVQDYDESKWQLS